MSQRTLLQWPYVVHYGQEKEVSTDVLVLGGGIAGCWAAIAAARKGLKVTIVEKGATIRSGAGGSGVDHWLNTPNPCSKITAEEVVDAELDPVGGYANALSRYIAARESYDTLLEMERMGGKIRDTEDEFKGADFRDEETKFLFAYDHASKLHFRVWGTGFKPALYNECRRLGVEIYDRTMATSLLTEGGRQGSRVVGATGLNVRTGEFTVFKAKATVLCLSRPQRIWVFSTESGSTMFRQLNNAGNGHAMAWRAGARFTYMERSRLVLSGSPHCLPGSAHGNAYWCYFPCTVVDAKGKEIPWLDRDGNKITSVEERARPAQGQKFMSERATNDPSPYKYGLPTLIKDLRERTRKGEFVLPFYADLPGMPDHYRRAIWGLMVGQEGQTNVPLLRTYTEAGFDANKDLLQSYMMLGSNACEMSPNPQERTFGEAGDAGGIVVDWDLRTDLEGLYAAGDTLFAGNYHYHAATTGRYAGRKAAGYALKAAEPAIAREQVDKEKARVCAPIEREDGIGWQELNAGICRVMQNYCSEFKNEDLLNIGLLWLRDIEENVATEAFATDPHKLGRTLEVLDILTCAQMIIHACLARKASSRFLEFYRTDYGEIDPPEWHKWITIKQDGEEAKIGELPIDFWRPLKENYEAHNKDYEGYYNK